MTAYQYGVKVDSEKCIGCGTCEDGCPGQAFQVINDIAICEDGDCVACGCCVEECPSNAITYHYEKGN